MHKLTYKSKLFLHEQTTIKRFRQYFFLILYLCFIISDYADIRVTWQHVKNEEIGQ